MLRRKKRGDTISPISRSLCSPYIVSRLPLLKMKLSIPALSLLAVFATQSLATVSVGLVSPDGGDVDAGSQGKIHRHRSSRHQEGSNTYSTVLHTAAWIDGDDACNTAVRIVPNGQNPCEHSFRLANGVTYHLSGCGTSDFTLRNADGSVNAKCVDSPASGFDGFHCSWKRNYRC